MALRLTRFFLHVFLTLYCGLQNDNKGNINISCKGHRLFARKDQILFGTSPKSASNEQKLKTAVFLETSSPWTNKQNIKLRPGERLHFGKW